MVTWWIVAILRSDVNYDDALIALTMEQYVQKKLFCILRVKMIRTVLFS